MEYFAELMQRLLEIESGGTQRSAELITEDSRLMEDLQKSICRKAPPQTVKSSQDSPERIADVSFKWTSQRRRTCG
jgi:hypothetical protein